MSERPYVSPSEQAPIGRLPISLEIADILRWLHERWAPVGALAISLPVIYTYHYAVDANIPLSVVSGNMIATYPAMLALLIFLALVLIVFTLLPAAVLLTPNRQQGQSPHRPALAANGPAASKMALLGGLDMQPNHLYRWAMDRPTHWIACPDASGFRLG